MDFIALSVPAFFILIGLELAGAAIAGRKWFRFNDAVTNLSCGIGSQVLGAFFAIITFWGYTYTYENFSLLKIAETPLNWFLLFLGVDFAYYWFHRLSHEINAIWATHIVHHQSEEYNLTVALRQSWFQSLFSWWFYLPLAFLGFSPLMIVTVGAVNTLYQFWIHTKAIKKLPAPIEFIFNTPSHHRVHHGTNPQYIDKNHAGSLIIWDRMFGTFIEEKEEVVYGITNPLNSFNPFRANFHYWFELVDTARKADNFKDKLFVFIKPPGWFPASLGGFKPAPPVDLNHVHKYDTKTTAFTNIYILIQFALILGITSYYMFFSKDMIQSGDPSILFFAMFMAGFILLSLYVFSLFFENRKTAYGWEISRQLLSLGMLWFYKEDAIFNLLLAGFLGIVFISLLVLFIKYKTESGQLKAA